MKAKGTEKKESETLLKSLWEGMEAHDELVSSEEIETCSQSQVKILLRTVLQLVWYIEKVFSESSTSSLENVKN